MLEVTFPRLKPQVPAAPVFGGNCPVEKGGGNQGPMAANACGQPGRLFHEQPDRRFSGAGPPRRFGARWMAPRPVFRKWPCRFRARTLPDRRTGLYCGQHAEAIHAGGDFNRLNAGRQTEKGLPNAGVRSFICNPAAPSSSGSSGMSSFLFFIFLSMPASASGARQSSSHNHGPWGSRTGCRQWHRAGTPGRHIRL
jgi:hypothetical protein